jgi:NADH-quinone oxidoreductase subunit F
MAVTFDMAEMEKLVDGAVSEFGRSPSSVLPILQKIQEHYRYLPEVALRRVCEKSEITPAGVAGVSTFYSQFRHKPVGRHIISVCHGTACHVKGAELIQDAIARQLKLKGEEDTDAEGVFTIQKVACLGCCTLAPVIQIDGVTYGHLTTDTVPKALRDFLELEKRGIVSSRFDLSEKNVHGLAEIRIGIGSCCIAGGSLDVRDALQNAVRESGADALIKPVGCVGMCHQTPLVEVVAAGGVRTLYAKVKSQDAGHIVQRHFKPKGLVRRIKVGLSSAIEHLLTDESWEPVTRYAIDVRDAPVCAFLGRQKHIASEWSGNLSPIDMDEYIAHDGFKALHDVFSAADPLKLIAAISESGLRGRGGAGFPTGRKWSIVRTAKGTSRYVVCNGDEGDPGAFMDRMLLESYPFRVLEGMIIAAYAIGAHEGYLYIRAEYPLALRRIRQAIKIMEERGYLGDDILKSGFGLRLKIVEGAGAFVSGEETGLIAAVEGRRSMPRFRPPYPAEVGLWGKPTSINNVETFALVPWIVRHGAAEFAKLGTKTSKGTKVFALAGKIARGGLIEVPMGITMREIVEEIGGGTTTGKPFKAVQVGGPSGGCIPASLGDTPVDYEALTAAGAIMGSGGLVVLDESDCMVDIARYFMTFTQRESCGKCTYCRIGTKRMLEILERLCGGKGEKGDLEKLEQIGRATQAGSLCGLGRTAPNPVLSTLKYFRHEYEAHLEHRCPSKKCRALIKYTITDDCIGCTRCAQRCPSDAIPMAPYRVHDIIQDKCTKCDSCRQICPVDAVKVE